MSYSLTDSERAALTRVQERGAAPESRHARIILMSANGSPVSDIAAAVSLSTRQVHYWRRKWREQGLALFADDITGASGVQAAAEPAPEVIAPESEIEDAPEAEPESEAAPEMVEPRLPLILADRVGMLPDDPMAEAGRKALFFHFERMLLNEPGSRLGEDIEAVHDMRVATRRMRSAMRLFKPFFKRGTLKPFRRELRQTARVLGDVRDLDVFIEKAQCFASDNPDVTLDPLFGIWEKSRRKARRALIAHLDSKGFARFVRQFHAFLTTPGEGAKKISDQGVTAFRVRHIAPRLIYEHYEQVRAYDTVIEGAPVAVLHALRIDFKRLRYTLEFFEEVLGPDARDVIKEVKVMQDHLGDLHDTEVVLEVLRDIIDRHNARYSGIPLFMRPDFSGVAAYAVAKEAEQQQLIETFPAVWARFNRDEMRQKLALAVAVL